MIQGILVEGLIYGILALGVFISFRILDCRGSRKMRIKVY